MSAKTIAFAPRRKGGDAPLVINTDTIRYIQMKRNYAEVHLTNGAVFTSRITMEELEQHLGDDFIKVHRSCLVAVRAIHSVENTVVLNNGEQLEAEKADIGAAANTAKAADPDHAGRHRAHQRRGISRALQKL